MGLTEPGDEAVVAAAAREIANIVHYRGLSNNQTVQALITVSASVLSVVSKDEKELLESNLKMFCKHVKEKARSVLPGHRKGRQT